ncbi:DUF4421 family protein [Galbibacter mesophilus]|uniref:DUF4421 family protein n=1 Tax=Galbibacter mesophilus TaxID=379069 RepID=UPI00191F7D64|nr:DUF4421 family protein [Galbibacter mesophilus]MCM5662109.1 DUF4421 domain-containing protein [Galbibacter mesophilus]
MKPTKITFSVLFFICLLGFSQDQEVDTTASEIVYKKQYPNRITFRVGLTDDFNSYEISNPDTGLDVLLGPNQEIRSTFSLLFRFVEINIGHTPKFIKFNDDNDEKGETSYFHFGTRFYIKKWMQNFEWTKTQGYFVDLRDFGGEQDYLIFPDFKVTRVGGNTAFVFNENFSFRTIFKQNEWQQISAGSFVPTLSYYYSRISNGTPEKDKVFDITVGPAYFYNWVINKQFIVTSGAHAGIGYTTINTYDGNHSDGVNYQTELTLGLGYNRDGFFTGINANYRAFYHNTSENFDLKDQHSFLEFHIGYRFKAPKIIIDKTNQLEEKVNNLVKPKKD